MIPQYNYKYINELNDTKKEVLRYLNRQVKIKPVENQILNNLKTFNKNIININSDSLLRSINTGLKSYIDELDVLTASILPFKKRGRPEKEKKQPKEETETTRIITPEEFEDRNKQIDELIYEIEEIKEEHKRVVKQHNEYIAKLREDEITTKQEITLLKKTIEEKELSNKRFKEMMENYIGMLRELEQLNDDMKKTADEANALNVSEDVVLKLFPTVANYTARSVYTHQAKGQPKVEIIVEKVKTFYEIRKKYKNLYQETIVLRSKIIEIVEGIQLPLHEQSRFISVGEPKEGSGRIGGAMEYNVNTVFNNINEFLKKLLIDTNRYLVAVSKNISKSLYYDKIDIQDFNNIKKELVIKYNHFIDIFYKRSAGDYLPEESEEKYNAIFDNIKKRLDEISKFISSNVNRPDVIQGSGFSDNKLKRNYM